MSKKEREDERPDETPVTVIDFQATIYARNRPTFVTFANANSNSFQYGIIYSIFSCLVPRNSEFLAVPPPKFLNLGTAKFFFVPPKLWTTAPQPSMVHNSSKLIKPSCASFISTAWTTAAYKQNGHKNTENNWQITGRLLRSASTSLRIVRTSWSTITARSSEWTIHYVTTAALTCTP